MAKKVKTVDRKMEKVVQIIEQAADEIVGAAQDAGKLIGEINAVAAEIQNDLQNEVIVEEEAAARYQAEVVKRYGKLANRIIKMAKNNKAITGMLAAMKAMGDEEKEKES